ncbi:hypothetical protein [Pedobacter terrae]|uniref:hypothetical protein n=1 Tax=Pedobacter terrae TaxID=405671 RepID=UPI002FF732C9
MALFVYCTNQIPLYSMLNNPLLALCENRNVLPKNNEKSGSPEEWFSNHLLSAHGLLGINFDFFVNWFSSPNTLSSPIWIKQVLSVDKGYPDFLDNVKQNLIDRFGAGFIKSLLKFSMNFSLKSSFIILDDHQDWSNAGSKVCIVDVNEDFSFNAQLLSIGNFKAAIQTYSGGRVYVGSKGLIYGTTNLECELSKTDSAYPGDMDMLLLNEDADPVAIFEFKKHTLSNDVSTQTLSNYYPHKDGRKYDRLAVFREYILEKSGCNVPMLILYYPSSSKGEYGRVELVDGTPGKLTVKASGKFKLPIDKSSAEFERMANLIPKFIALSR